MGPQKVSLKKYYFENGQIWAQKSAPKKILFPNGGGCSKVGGCVLNPLFWGLPSTVTTMAQIQSFPRWAWPNREDFRCGNVGRQARLGFW